MPTTIRVAVGIWFSLVSGLSFGQSTLDEPIKTTLCELLKEPERFNGKMVQFRAVVFYGFEASLLRDDSCSAEVWLAAGFAINMTLPGGVQKPSSPPIVLKKDSDYQKMSEYLSKSYTNSEHQTGPLYTVTVNAIGRFEHVNKRKTTPEERRYTGFGHMRVYESQLVLQSVSDVTAELIDTSVYEKRK
jgi:hypothetical protein